MKATLLASVTRRSWNQRRQLSPAPKSLTRKGRVYLEVGALSTYGDYTVIYVLKFSQPIGNPNNPRAMASFYVGYCDDDTLPRRLAEHRAGRGAAITAAA